LKILAIIASPRGMQGNTGRLLEEVLAGANEYGAETEVLSLKTLNVQPCVACDICHTTGLCNIKDDYEGIKDKLLESDGFILASPNYIFSVTAQMKALFDRCNGLIHCMALEGKYAAIVETSGSGEDEEVIAYMERFVKTLGANSVGGIGSPMVGPQARQRTMLLCCRKTAVSGTGSVHQQLQGQDVGPRRLHAGILGV
jgi:multimeric flavodoxin WrbA